MTHDELIAYIDDSTDGLKHEHLFEKLLANTKALRAVVELHKPYGSADKGFICEFCMDRALPAWVYPCPTIQAIQEQLK